MVKEFNGNVVVSERLVAEIIDSYLDGEHRQDTIKRLGITRECYMIAVNKYLKNLRK